jgi:hypothetical protein
MKIPTPAARPPEEPLLREYHIAPAAEAMRIRRKMLRHLWERRNKAPQQARRHNEK